MNGPVIEKVARRLGRVLVWARRKAIVFSLLTALCAPAFVALVSLAARVLLLPIARQPGYWTDVATIYTGMVFFLGLMLILVLVGSAHSLVKTLFSKMWLAGVGIFLLLLILMYRTSLPARTPDVFGMLFIVGSLLILGLIGQVPQAGHAVRSSGTCKDISTGLVVLCGGIVTAYGELLSASWLWVQPRPQEVRIAAGILYRLAIEPDEPFDSSTVNNRVMALLFRLNLVKMAENELRLTPKGMDFVWSAAKD